MTEFSTKDKQGIALAAIAGLAFLGLFAAYITLANKDPLDERLCPKIIERKTVFLIDRSDDTPSQTIVEIKNRIAKTIADEVKDGELVSIFYITDSAQQDLRPVFSMCKPQSEGNIVYEDQRTIARRFEASFRKPLDAALQEQPSGGEISPVAETLTDFLASDFLDGQVNRLSVFSDLMQNSDGVSLYQCSDQRAAVAAYRQARAGAVERPKLKNVEVILNIIPRAGLGTVVVRCRDGFWAWFFGDNEGENAGVTSSYLPGGASIK
jgi:hypothetical protein